MPHYSGPNEVHSFQPLTPMLLPLVVDIEVVVVDSPAQGAAAALKHSVAARAGEISRSKPTCLLISFTTNSTHDRHRNNNSNNSFAFRLPVRIVINRLGLITKSPAVSIFRSRQEIKHNGSSLFPRTSIKRSYVTDNNSNS